MTLNYDGHEYDFDSEACYLDSDIIRLPDGRHLEVLGWREGYPPQPAVVQLLPEDAIPPEDATPATLVF